MQVAVGYRQRNDGFGLLPNNDLRDFESHAGTVPVIFEIPKYQREYTWGSREWEALFDDLTENDDGYFLGSIICINSATDTINAPKFEVVDGQQRLTTLSLFLAALYTTLNSTLFKISIKVDYSPD